MFNKLLTISVVLVFLSVPHLHAETLPTLSDAQAVFKRYSSLEAAFDPAIADLYADDALIKNRRVYPDGTVRELVMPAHRYKQMLRTVMPLAKARGDYSTYSKVSFSREGEGVRVTANRFSVLKKYQSPLSLLFIRSSSGVWLIHEELSESRP